MKALFALLIFVILLYPLIMSTETWGLMPKNQEDNEKIEEAIARLIAEHEESPTSHTGENESLAAHRENEVLDHLQGSVVADKFSTTEMIWQTNFGEHALWTKHYVHDYDWPGMSIPEEGGEGEVPYMYQNFANIIGYTLPINVDFYFQAMAQVGEFADGTSGRFGFGVSSVNTNDSFGFKFTNTTCKIFFRVDTTESEASVSSFADGDKHTFRAIWVAADAKAYFYVDGVLVGELSKPAGTLTDQVRWGFNLTLGSSSGDGEALFMFHLVLARQHD